MTDIGIRRPIESPGTAAPSQGLDRMGAGTMDPGAAGPARVDQGDGLNPIPRPAASSKAQSGILRLIVFIAPAMVLITFDWGIPYAYYTSRLFAIICGICGIFYFRECVNFVFRSSFFMFFLWIGLAALSILYSLAPDISWDRLQSIFLSLIPLIIIHVMAKEKNDQTLLLAGYVAAGSLLAVLTFVFYDDFLQKTGNVLRPTTTRIAGPLLNANEYGFAMALTFVCTLFYILCARTKAGSFLAIAFLFPQLICVSFSGSRGAVVVVLIGVCMFFLTLVLRYKIRGLIWASIFCVLGAMGTVVAVAEFGDQKSFAATLEKNPTTNRLLYLLYKITGDQAFKPSDYRESSFSHRAELIADSAEIFARNPIFGTGLDTVQVQKSSRGGVFSQKIGTYAHSAYFEILTATGAVGMLVIVMGIGVLLFGFVPKRTFGAPPKPTEDIAARNRKASLCALGLTLALIFAIRSIFSVTIYSNLGWMCLLMSIILLPKYVLRNSRDARQAGASEPDQSIPGIQR